jgi:hypothetical protein
VIDTYEMPMPMAAWLDRNLDRLNDVLIDLMWVIVEIIAESRNPGLRPGGGGDDV